MRGGRGGCLFNGLGGRVWVYDGRLMSLGLEYGEVFW